MRPCYLSLGTKGADLSPDDSLVLVRRVAQGAPRTIRTPGFEAMCGTPCIVLAQECSWTLSPHRPVTSSLVISSRRSTTSPRPAMEASFRA